MTAVGEFHSVKDAGVLKAGGEEWSNAGGASAVRPMKGRQHFLAMDFNWTDVEAFIAANPLEPGWTMKVELRLVAAFNDDLMGMDCRLVLIENETVWTEGDGPHNYANFNWSAQADPAITSKYAQTNLDGTGTGPWPWGDFDGKRNVAGQYNFYELTWNAANVPSWVELDPIFFGKLRPPTTDNYHGLYTYDVDSNWSNGMCYTRDQNSTVDPMLRITFIPEPASLLLIGLGGVGVLLRKKR
jgi:hypothetical protein